ncbi:MAG: nitroreductase family protein [Acholeplasmatales bacterium]|nr:nitroreductase family protein [Acholeplasmatales bacterium]
MDYTKYNKSYFDVINDRYSCREFTDEVISIEQINMILEAGRVAPSAVNFQPVKIIVLRDEKIINEIIEKRATKYLFNAKTIFIICYDENISWHRGYDNVDHGVVDASICTTHMMLAIEALGLGTTYVCSFKEDLLKEILNLDKNIHVSAILPCGYKNEFKPHRERKELKDLVIWK